MDYFILSGSTTRGDLITARDRAAVLDLWLETVDPRRLLACCWEADDITLAVARGITPMVVIRRSDHDSTLELLRELPSGATIYSHPMFEGAVFTASLARQAQAEGVLPAGGKLAKVTTQQIQEISAVTSGSFRLWDGSCRQIEASLVAGAAGVVATPLGVFADDFPPKDLLAIQAEVNSIQATLDALPDRQARSRYLAQEAFRTPLRDMG
ncbi:hypothetical protein AB0I30_03095 [Nocardia tengchongensis]|uniref:hypothetical protein n=1 Tax=Nocardia tengchongensis TaxID=2055889 RepID=UPI00340DC05F